MNHIELFAGCGGLCLGLEKAGFDLTMANELSPMAAETFSYNFLGEILSDKTNKRTKTLWLASNYSAEEISLRLREDPRSFPDLKNCELDDDGGNILNSLVIGNINSLNKWLTSHPLALKKLKDQNVDLISGGPPCQSFSLAGLREKNNAKNKLPLVFAEFVEKIRPKIVLLENVSGILRPFTEGGKKYYAWFEVAKTFAKKNYYPLCLHINAKYAGVAQNRPRFILIAIERTFYKTIKNTFNDGESILFNSSENFFYKVSSKVDVDVNDIKIFDLNTNDPDIFKLFKRTFLSPLVKKTRKFYSVKDAIGDLETISPETPSKYVTYINNSFNKFLALPSDELTGMKKHNICSRVQRRYRIYQIMNLLSKNSQKDIGRVISGKKDYVEESTWLEVKDFKFLDMSNQLSKMCSRIHFEEYLIAHRTKKQVQRALVADEPAPAAMSIADDACHYDELRTMTIREMARIQSFPDSFVFRSKATTGGLNRRYEVPIYTQIGNAVPVLLGYALGLCVKQLLSRADLAKFKDNKKIDKNLFIQKKQSQIHETNNDFKIVDDKKVNSCNYSCSC